MQPTAPRWSPDSTRIAFFDASSGKPFQLFLVPANGGSPQAVVDEPWNEIDPNWSPDGRTLVFSHFPVFDRQADLGMYSFDLVTHRLAKLPGSDGLWMPRWAPDGSSILGRLGHPFRCCFSTFIDRPGTNSLVAKASGTPTGLQTADLSTF